MGAVTKNFQHGLCMGIPNPASAPAKTAWTPQIQFPESAPDRHMVIVTYYHIVHRGQFDDFLLQLNNEHHRVEIANKIIMCSE